MTKRLTVVAAVMVVTVSGCGKSAKPELPSSLIGAWHHEVNQDFLKEFTLDDKQIAEMVLTFDAEGGYTELVRFTGGQGEVRSAGTFSVERQEDETGSTQASLSDGDGLFAGGHITLSGDAKLTASGPGIAIEFTFTPYD